MTTTCLTFDFDALSIWFSTFRQTTPVALSRGEYAGRVGVIRVLEMLKRQEVLATFFVPAHTAAAFPEMVRRIAAEGHEIACHGFVHESPVNLPIAEEECFLLGSRDALERLCGEVPVGYRSPAWDLSENSLSLLEKHDFLYDSSLMSDDFTPYRPRKGDVLTDTGFDRGVASSIVEFPVAWELDDFPYFHFSWKLSNPGLQSPDAVYACWRGEFDYCHAHVPNGVFTLTCHPEVIGRGPRILMLEKLVTDMKAVGSEFLTMKSAALRQAGGRSQKHDRTTTLSQDARN